MIRPTIGNTIAIGRFSPGGVAGYAPVYLDGTLGPRYTTRAEAEEDWARRNCPTCGGTGYVADVYGEAEAEAAYTRYKSGVAGWLRQRKIGDDE